MEWVLPPETEPTRLGAADQHLRLARVLRNMGSYDAALGQAEAALGVEPASEAARLLKFWLLTKTSRFDAAEELLDAVTRINPCEPYIFELLGARLRTSADAERLLAYCERALARDPAGANPTYFKALALVKLGRDEAARELVSPWRDVEIVDPEAPPDWLHRLGEEIGSHPRLKADPAGKSLDGGKQTGLLDPQDGPAVAAVMQFIRGQVETYAAGLAASGTGFARGRPARGRLAVWGVVCGASGRQRSHRHPNGWLSGVFYVAGPADERGLFRGPLLVGDTGEAFTAPWKTRPVEPRPGRLVLFPSYMPHSTVPSGVDGDRISIAFDVEAG